MPRIPQADLDRLKTDHPLADYLPAHGIELKPHGTHDLIGHCPFHNDKTPSLIVTPAKGLWHCMGACQKGGDVVSFVMQRENVSFREAVAKLQGNIDVTPCPFTLDADEQGLLSQAAQFYHETLRESETGKAYLSRRGILNEEAINTFKLGMAERSPGLSLPPRATQMGARLRDRLAKVGVLRKTSGHEHLAGSLIIPIIDAEGRTLNLYGRRLNTSHGEEDIRHLYLPGPRRGVFNGQGLNGEAVILCESLIDALTFWVNGFKSVTSSYGVEGYTAEVHHALLQSGAKTVLIAYDHDAAGDAAAVKLALRLGKDGFLCRRVRFPHGMDANAFACRMQPAALALQLLLDTAPRMNAEGQMETAPSAPLPEPPKTQVTHTLPVSSTLPVTTVLPVSDPPVSGALPTVPAAATVQGEDVHLLLQNRAYRVRGLFKNLAYDHLKVNVRVSLKDKNLGDRFYLDQLDLYNARHRETFVQNASVELEQKGEVLKKDLGRLLLELERLQDEAIQKTLANAETDQVPAPMLEAERADALALLRSPRLIERILEDFETLGVVGEGTNKLTAYLACVSRKMDKPLGLIIQSTSAAGKTALMDAVIAMLPRDAYVRYSAMTSQSLYYLGEKGLQHKVLCICEEEGAAKASYALKLLQSDGRLTIAAAGKDEKTGTLLTKEYTVEGPVAVMLSTTSVAVDEELQNRCLILSVDESRTQTKAIHKAQREKETLAGLIQNEKAQRLLLLHQNAQRLLAPLKVVNDYAPFLTFSDGQTRMRRDHMKYLTLIRVITLLHQYQRPLKEKDGIKYIETTLEDIHLANRLAHQVLGRTLDELPPQTRNLLTLLSHKIKADAEAKEMKPSDLRFSRREVRAWTGWGNTQLKVHLGRLEDMEYLLIHKSQRGMTYELLYQGEGKGGEAFLLGLVDVDTLNLDLQKSVVNEQRSGSGRPPVGVVSGGGRGRMNDLEPSDNGARKASAPINDVNTVLADEKNHARSLFLDPILDLNPELLFKIHGA